MHQELIPMLDQFESPDDALTTATATDEDEGKKCVFLYF
jgi:hypothetical protein